MPVLRCILKTGTFLFCYHLKLAVKNPVNPANPVNPGSDYSLHFLRRQLKRYGVVLKMPFVRTVAEGFVFGQSAAANGNQGTALQTISIALGIHNFKISLYFQGTVVVYSQSGSSHWRRVRFSVQRYFTKIV